MSDTCGIPDNMFGPVPEQFFGLLGRIVMVTSLLELRVLDLLTELEQIPQQVHAGRPGAELIKACRRRLGDYDPAFAEAAAAVLDRVRDALHRRNAVVHSIWPAPRAESAYGWRPLPKGQRQRASSWLPYQSLEVSAAQLRELVAGCVAMVDDLDRLRGDAYRARRATL